MELDDLKEQLEAEVVEWAKRLRTAIAVRNPKRTGRSAASWNLAVGEANDAMKDKDYDNVEGCVEEGEVDVEGFQLGQELHVSNNQAYIRRLNAGYSRQAPAAFVEATVAAAEEGMI